MRIIELKKCTTYSIIFKGRIYNFKKDKPEEVPELLADQLLSTGDFMDVIVEDPNFQVGAIIKDPKPLVDDTLRGEVIVPLDKVEDTIDHKMEMPFDLKKSKKKDKKKGIKKYELD